MTAWLSGTRCVAVVSGELVISPVVPPAEAFYTSSRAASRQPTGHRWRPVENSKVVIG